MTKSDYVIRYYDALHRRRGAIGDKLDSRTQHQLRNILTEAVLCRPEGLLPFMEQINTKTHISMGFYKPWDWYSHYTKSPSIIEHLLETHYVSEFKNTTFTKINSHHTTTLLLTANVGNKFINLMDKRELFSVRNFTKYIIENEIRVPFELLISLAYIHMLTGKPQLSLTLYKMVLVQYQDYKLPSNGKSSVQYIFFKFVYECYNNTSYALSDCYTNRMITKHIIHNEPVGALGLKSLRLFMDMLFKDIGHSSLFEQSISFRKLIANHHRYKSYLPTDSPNIDYSICQDIFFLIPSVVLMFKLLSEITNSITIDSDLYQNITRYVQSGNLIMTDDDRDEFTKIYDRLLNDKDSYVDEIRVLYNLFIGR